MPKCEHTIEIGRYVVEKKVGQGAMGEVFSAHDHRIGRRIAVKTLRLEKIKSGVDRQLATNLFLREAKIYGKLNHAHIAAIYDMGIHQGAPFLVMEFIEGKDLKDIIVRKVKYSLKDKVSILAIIARALHYAHQRGVLHRDIKPANIMLLANNTPKITDFGIARVMDTGDNLEDEGNESDIIGTPHYMSPEHIRAKGYDCHSDIFSLGIVAYEWLSNGKRPFVAKGLKDLLKAILNEQEKSLVELGNADQRLSDIVTRTLAKRPEDRFQNAEELSDSLELYLNSLEMAETEIMPVFPTFDKSKIIKRLKEKYFFFADFSEDELSTIFKLSQKKKYITGEYVIREGTLGTKMYVIITGSVSIQNETDGQNIEIEQLGAGSCVGEMAMVDKLERSASVVALEPTLTIAINETVLRLSNPKISLKLYRNLAALLSEKLRINDERYKNLLASTKNTPKKGKQK